MPLIAGIDLGTTNSLIGVWRNERAELIPNVLEIYLTPSVVGLDDSGEILVGQPAVERMHTHPHLTASVFKRYMGTSRSIKLGKQSFRPEELSSLVLRSLKRDAEAVLQETVAEAVISVPAYFNDVQRRATRIAGELAGLNVERLINEPTAAALSYGLHHAEPQSQFLVFDLGGGTFDVTVLELFEGIMEVRSSAGDNFLGGEDFVEVIIDRFMDFAAASAMTRQDIEQDQRLYQAIRHRAEMAKRQLTQNDKSLIALNWKGRPIEFEFSQEEFRTWAEPLLARIRQPVERALRDARIRPSELNEILLVGGATRMPLVRALVAKMFGRFPSAQVHPDEAVALGTAVQAGLKARDSALKEVVLTDVCPYTLGVEVGKLSTHLNAVQAGFFSPIIERNTVIPASRVERFHTLIDKQTLVEMRIFQGEARMVRDNILLGKIAMPVPPKPMGEESVDVRFTYDINGLLEVEGTVVSTGIKKTIVIEESPGALSPAEIRERIKKLSSLKIHPRDQVENRTLLARADRLFEQSLGAKRDLIGAKTADYADVLTKQNPRQIEKARDEFSKFLDAVDSQSPLNDGTD